MRKGQGGAVTLAGITNLAILLVCAAMLAILARNSLLKPHPTTPVGRTVKSLPSAPSHDATILLALSTHCPYCARSVPFYQELLRAASASRGRIAIGAQFLPGQSAEAFLRENRLDTLPSFGALDPSIGVKAVPTLLVCDKRNRVVKAWEGYIDPTREGEVYETLRKLCPSCTEALQRTAL